MSLLILLGAFCMAIALGGAFLFFLNRRQKKNTRNRTLSVIRGAPQAESRKSERNMRDKRRAEIVKKLQDENAEQKQKKKDGLKQKLAQAGMTVTPRQFMLFSFIFAVIITGLVLVSGRGMLVTVLVAITAFLGLPRFFLRWRIKRRQKAFLADFADTLEAMVRLLKAGMPVGEAIVMAAHEFEGPIGEEMAHIYEAQKIGISLPEATMEAARRMPLTEMKMFATGISIQSQTGSSLSEVLTNLARVIRARYRLKRKVQALSSEAKASAMIIGFLPFLIGGGLYLINTKYMMVLFTTPTGQAWLIGSAVWMTLGCLVMKVMINFKI